MEQRLQFYQKAISKFIPDKQANILVVAGGKNDALVLNNLGYTNVLISNITPTPLYPVAPYPYCQENAEQLSFPDNSFEYVIVCAALHHLAQPHKGLLEVYRVAGKGAIMLEATDNTLMNMMVGMGIAEDYEQSAVQRQHNHAGGTNNTEVPNYVYRWKAREIEKTIKSYAPHAKHTIQMMYGLTLPYTMEMANKWYYNLFRFCLNAILWFAPAQKNLCCAYIAKPTIPQDLHPWINNTGTDIKNI